MDYILFIFGIKSKVAKSTLAYWNETRDWRIYAELAQLLIATARPLYKGDNDFLKDLDASVYAFDSTTIDLCLTLFPWAKFRKKKLPLKLIHYWIYRAISQHGYLLQMEAFTM